MYYRLAECVLVFVLTVSFAVPNAAILISEHYEESIEDLIFLERYGILVFLQ